MHLLILTKDLSDNSTGRAHVIWQLARHLGWTTEVVAPTGAELWRPLADSDFAANSRVVARRSRASRAELEDAARRADLVIAVKPVPGSLDRGMRLSRVTNTPLLLDIDDPDLESRTGEGRPLEALAKAVLRPTSFWPSVWFRRRVSAFPVIVSNPVLQRRYGGTIIPHARADFGDGVPHTRTSPVVAFVGTVRKNKGLSEVRAAVANLQNLGFRLVVTDDPPDDAREWEEWSGPSTLEEGRRIVQAADIVVLVSDPRMAHSRGQLPAKLVDAMVAGRAIVVSDLEPMVWATGGASRVANAGTPGELDAALTALVDPELRSRLGALARHEARERFEVSVVARSFREACESALMSGRKR